MVPQEDLTKLGMAPATLPTPATFNKLSINLSRSERTAEMQVPLEGRWYFEEDAGYEVQPMVQVVSGEVPPP